MNKKAVCKLAAFGSSVSIFLVMNSNHPIPAWCICATGIALYECFSRSIETNYCKEKEENRKRPEKEKHDKIPWEAVTFKQREEQ